MIPGSVVNIVLYCRREEVLPETFASLIPPALPAPPIYEVMGDHGSPAEPPLASESDMVAAAVRLRDVVVDVDSEFRTSLLFAPCINAFLFLSLLS